MPVIRKILKQPEAKRHITWQAIKIKITSGLLSKIMQARNPEQHLESAKRETCQPRILSDQSILQIEVYIFFSENKSWRSLIPAELCKLKFSGERKRIPEENLDLRKGMNSVENSMF